MRSRFTRLAAIAAGVVGLLGSYTPPAQAHTVGVAVFGADVTVGPNGIGYPFLTLTTFGMNFLPSGTPTTTTEHLVPDDPPNVLTLPNDPGTPKRNETAEHLKAHAVDAQRVDCLPLPQNSVLWQVETVTGATWNCHWVFDHPQTVTVRTLDPGVGGPLCRDVLVNFLKSKQPVHPPGCIFGGTGTVTGHCGLSGGQVTVTYTDGLGNTYTMGLHFRGVGGLLVISGHWTNNLNQHGKIYALAAAVPPTPVRTPGQSCTDKSARDFLVVGVAALYSDPNLL